MPYFSDNNVSGNFLIDLEQAKHYFFLIFPTQEIVYFPTVFIYF